MAQPHPFWMLYYASQAVGLKMNLQNTKIMSQDNVVDTDEYHCPLSSPGMFLDDRNDKLLFKKS